MDYHQKLDFPHIYKLHKFRSTNKTDFSLLYEGKYHLFQVFDNSAQKKRPNKIGNTIRLI